jgi:hypothetical protein
VRRHARYVGTAGRATLWRITDAEGFARAFPSTEPPPRPSGLWADVDGVLVRVPADFGREAFVRQYECTGRAAQVLRGRYHHAGGGL